MRNRVYLVGNNDCIAFCNVANKFSDRIELVDRSGRYRVNAKSVLGCLMASGEWGEEIWVESDADLYEDFKEWIAIDADDAANIHE